MAAVTISVSMALGRLQRAAADLEFLEAGLCDDALSPADATSLVSLLGSLEKRCGALALRVARRTGGHAPTLVSVATGTPTGAAKRTLATMERLRALPVLSEAVAKGQVSLDQAAVMAPAVERSPSCAPSLLHAAASGSFEELRKESLRTQRAARCEEDQVQKERRLHAGRRCRVWQSDDGAVCLEARFAPLDGARLMAALDKETEAVFKASWRAQVKDPRERCGADALVNLVTGTATTAGAQVIVRVDAAALRRGSLQGDELCEIDGVGPISVDAARTLLADATITTLVRDGIDVASVTRARRAIPSRLKTALEDRDRCCVVPGCGSTHRLEIHHWRTDVFSGGPTELDNLCRLCPVHHRLQTNEGYRIGGGPGKWKWVAPG
jgi:hypothetical protein